MNLLLVYLLLINAIGLILMLADKQAAKKKRRRIPQKHLLLTALFGGSIGVFLGMKIAHHKTRHKKFSVGVPIMILLQAVALFVLLQLVPLKTFEVQLPKSPSNSQHSNNSDKEEEENDPLFEPGYNPKDIYDYE